MIVTAPSGDKRGRDHADGGLDPMVARLDASQISQRDHQADGAVPAHAEVADIVEEDDARGASWVGRFAQQRAHRHVGTARLVDHRRAIHVEVASKPLPLLGQRSRAQRRAASDDHSRRLAGRV